MNKKIITVLVSTLALLLSVQVAWAQSRGKNPPPALTISAANADLNAGVIVVDGNQFGSNPAVFLGNNSGSLTELDVTASNDSSLTADLPAGQGGGTYVLVVTRGPSTNDVFSIDVTLGADGLQGPPGEQGPVGDKGPTGDQGPPGDQGPQGLAGADGADGADGTDGADGAQGADGDKGPTGDKGPPGDQGPTGNQGPTGLAGATGADGNQGPDGDKGPTGDKGPDGDKGPIGDKGPVGDQGPVGAAGQYAGVGSIQVNNGANTIAIDADNMQPFLGVYHAIAVQGIFPSRNGLDAFIGEIMTVGFNFAPRGWIFCDGQLLAISSNTALFSLLGTTYGGDGRTSFGVPDLRGRVALHPGQGPGLTNRVWGQKGGSERIQ